MPSRHTTKRGLGTCRLPCCLESTADVGAACPPVGTPEPIHVACHEFLHSVLCPPGRREPPKGSDQQGRHGFSSLAPCLAALSLLTVSIVDLAVDSLKKRGMGALFNSEVQADLAIGLQFRRQDAMFLLDEGCELPYPSFTPVTSRSRHQCHAETPLPICKWHTVVAPTGVVCGRPRTASCYCQTTWQQYL